MNSVDIINYTRPKLGASQAQYDALLRILNSGAKIDDLAIFLGMTLNIDVPKVEDKPKGKFVLSQRSLDRLVGVNSKLVAVVKRAIEITEIDFMVIEGLRTKETQAKYVKEGKSKTMNSYHLTGHAVDLAPLENGAIDWSNKNKGFNKVYDAMLKAANELGVTIEWGGKWVSFVDMPHYQIPR